MSQAPTSITVYTGSFESLDIKGFARLSRKVLERLMPWAHLQNFSAPEGAPIVEKIVKQVNTYIRTIDTAILSVLLAHRFAADAMVLCNLVSEERWGQEDQQEEATGSNKADSYDALSQELYHTLSVLAEEGVTWAQKTRDGFREVSQDLYKIAAATQDKDYLVEVPKDPTQNQRDKTLLRPLSTVGSDLVANLKTLTEYYVHVAHFSEWWSSVQKEIGTPGNVAVTSLTTELLPMDPAKFSTIESIQVLHGKWEKVRKETQGFYNMLDDLLEIYSSFLPISSAGWESVLASQEKSSPSMAVPSRSASAGSTEPPAPTTARVSSPATEKLKGLMDKFKISYRPGLPIGRSRSQSSSNLMNANGNEDKKPAKVDAARTLKSTSKLAGALHGLSRRQTKKGQKAAKSVNGSTGSASDGECVMM